MLLLSRRVLVWAIGGVILALAIRLVRRMPFCRVEVEGDIMRPTLLPGDRLLVLRRRRASPGDLVVVADPRPPGRLMVKRVAGADHLGWTVLGDNPAASTDSRTFGPLARLEGRPFYRYHPAHRAGRLRSNDADPMTLTGRPPDSGTIRNRARPFSLRTRSRP
ncbi:MAG: nickel-type superoxide dismutase maturation protease [Actinobacteria bacterium]|nr:nickel-type superoxide dismutase maturation protease [Actinomycetota bacterium]